MGDHGDDSGGVRLQPISLLDELPVGVLVEDLVAAKLVDVAPAVIQALAVLALAGDHPDGHGPVAADEGVDMIPAHVGNDLEAIGEDAADGVLAVHAPTD